jgi:hypothetical protein
LAIPEVFLALFDPGRAVMQVMQSIRDLDGLELDDNRLIPEYTSCIRFSIYDGRLL